MKLHYLLLLALAAPACSGKQKPGALAAISPADARFGRFKK